MTHDRMEYLVEVTVYRMKGNRVTKQENSHGFEILADTLLKSGFLLQSTGQCESEMMFELRTVDTVGLLDYLNSECSLLSLRPRVRVLSLEGTEIHSGLLKELAREPSRSHLRKLLSKRRVTRRKKPRVGKVYRLVIDGRARCWLKYLAYWDEDIACYPRHVIGVLDIRDEAELGQKSLKALNLRWPPICVGLELFDTVDEIEIVANSDGVPVDSIPSFRSSMSADLTWAWRDPPPGVVRFDDWVIYSPGRGRERVGLLDESLAELEYLVDWSVEDLKVRIATGHNPWDCFR